MADDFLIGRNSVLEALKADRTFNKIFFQEGERKGSAREIFRLALEKNIPTEIVNLKKLQSLAGDLPHQGVVATASPVAYYEIEDVLQFAQQKNQLPFLILLDEMQDPHNVGAIIRTACAAGVHGILLPKRRSCQVTSAVVRASAGTVEYMPIVRIGNIVQVLEKLKKQGLWTIGADMNAQVDYKQADLNIPLVLIIGGEDKGISRLVKEHCDMLLQIPMPGSVTSLNASVAGALLIYEVLRKRS